MYQPLNFAFFMYLWSYIYGLDFCPSSTNLSLPNLFFTNSSGCTCSCAYAMVAGY